MRIGYNTVFPHKEKNIFTVMDNRTFLIKAATLLYLESQLPELTDRSQDLIKTGIERMEKSKVFEIGPLNQGSSDVLRELRDIIVQMYNNPADYRYSREDLLQQFRIVLAHEEKVYEALEQGLNSDYSDSTIKRLIVTIRRSIQSHYKEMEVSDILNNASRTFLYNRSSIKDVSAFITSVIDQLEPLQINQSAKDPAIVGEVDIESDESVQNIFGSVKDRNTGTAVLKTGWQALNRALQGGIRRGEFLLLPASLQHKYKTGFSLSVFGQLARYNKPTTKDPNKKPMLLRISFEDSLESNMQFLYQQIKYTETKEPVDITGLRKEEMAGFVRSRLQANGFHVRFLRVDPTQWTYRHICNKVLEYEAQGYEIEVLMLDYLPMVPTTGCRQGPAGTDLRDMFRRIRNFCAPKDIAVLTPVQLSTEAKMLLRAGTSDLSFVREVAEKGYYTDSKQLDQEIDGELYTHIARHNREYYLTVMRGKHRITTILPEEEKYFLLKFPYKMPIPDDLLSEDSSFKKAPTQAELIERGYAPAQKPAAGSGDFDF